jgi:hypothetical protein
VVDIQRYVRYETVRRKTCICIKIFSRGAAEMCGISQHRINRDRQTVIISRKFNAKTVVSLNPPSGSHRLAFAIDGLPGYRGSFQQLGWAQTQFQFPGGFQRHMINAFHTQRYLMCIRPRGQNEIVLKMPALSVKPHPNAWIKTAIKERLVILYAGN